MAENFPERYKYQHAPADHHANTHKEVFCQGQDAGIEKGSSQKDNGDCPEVHYMPTFELVLRYLVFVRKRTPSPPHRVRGQGDGVRKAATYTLTPALSLEGRGSFQLETI